jgi:hypothetical protein
MKKLKVILRFLDGKIIKGYIDDFSPMNSHISILDERSNRQSIELNQLKAIFYVKSFQGNTGYAEKKMFIEPSQKGKKLIVKFKDGESLTGYLEGDVPWKRGFALESKKGGFFLIPADDKANNRKVFVVANSVTNVTCF